MATVFGRDNLRVLLVSASAETRDAVKTALTERGSGNQFYWIAESDLAPVRALDLLPDLILVDADLAGADGLELVRQLTTRLPAIPVLALVPEDGLDQARAMVLAGARGFITKPIKAEDLSTAWRQISSQPAALVTTEEASPAPGRVVAFSGPKGGTGRTTLAINTAVSLCNMQRGRVVLVDADYAAPAVDVALNVHADRTIADLLPKIAQVDRSLIESVLTLHESGLYLLLAPPPGELSSPLTPPQVQQLLVWLQRLFPWVLVDLGLPLDQMAYAFLDGADRAIVSIMPEMVGLRNAGTMFDQLDRRAYPAGKVWPVLNRAGLAGGLLPDEVEQRLGRPLRYQIPNDQELATDTINRGSPMVLLHRRSPVARACQALAQELDKTVVAGTGRVSLAAAATAAGLVTGAVVPATALPGGPAEAMPPPEPDAARAASASAPEMTPPEDLSLATAASPVAAETRPAAEPVAAVTASAVGGEGQQPEDVAVAIPASMTPAATPVTSGTSVPPPSVAGRPAPESTARPPRRAGGSWRYALLGLGVLLIALLLVSRLLTSRQTTGSAGAPAAGPKTLTPQSVAYKAATQSANQAVAVAPSATPTPTRTPLPTATRTPTNTPAPTDTPLPTDTPVPTSTPTSTETPVSTDTPVPTKTPTRRPTATRALPTATPVPSPVGVAPSLVSPAPQASASGTVTFNWQPATPLVPGTGYELVWWNPREDPQQARGVAPPTTGDSLNVNLDTLYNSGQMQESSLYWTVLVVQDSPYRRLTLPAVSNARLLTYQSRGGGSGGGGAPPPPR